VATEKQFLVSVPETALIDIATSLNIPFEEVTASVITKYLEESVNKNPLVDIYSREMYSDCVPFSHLPNELQRGLMLRGASENGFISIITAGLWVEQQKRSGEEIFSVNSSGVAEPFRD